MPLGHAVVAGMAAQGTPVFKAKMIPSNALRSSTGFLPA
jgi:hypothetical protein